MNNPKQNVKSHFSERADQWAGQYSDCQPHSLNKQNLLSRQRFAVEMIQSALPKGSSVLDVGCGAGQVSGTLMELGYQVWGVDLAEPMVAVAGARFGLDRFRVGDIEHIPFQDNTFDAVICLGVIEYVPTDENALKEIRRVLKSGGTAVVSTPSAISPLHRIDSVFAGLMPTARPVYHFLKYRLRGKPSPVQQPPGLVTHRRYHPGKWLGVLRSAGFEPQELICHGWGWYRSELGMAVAHGLARGSAVFARFVERMFGEASSLRAKSHFVRSPALNWLASEQIVRVRAVK